jgi:acetyltransferase-like isoleucine patch superfamily enzyme
MASLHYLWLNRAKFNISTLAFYKAWAKRILTFNDVLERNRFRKRLTKKGAHIDATAEIGKVKADGDKKKLTIGANSFIGLVEFALHDSITIGKNVCINDGVKLLSASHDVQDPLWRHIKKPIIIDDYAWITTGAIILPGVTIGRGAIVAAGAVVSKNVGPYEIVAGNPAVVINKKRIEDLQYNPCEFLAGNLAWLKG